MYDVTGLGEVLIDFTPQGKSARGNTLFERNPGGAPANVLAYLAKLNKNTAFIGKVGKDQFGVFLEETLKNSGIDTSGLVTDPVQKTTLAFVHIAKDGDRSFSFFRNPGADTQLSKQDIRWKLIEETHILHFGSLSLTHAPAREATYAALEYAACHNIIISYDPNLREPLWENLDLAKKNILEAMRFATLVKISEEELLFLTGDEEIEIGVARLLKMFTKIRLIYVTMGKEGCYFNNRTVEGYEKGFSDKAVDTTGAGDSFWGGVLYGLLESGKSPSELNRKELMSISRFANAGATLVTQRYGALSIMPELKEIEAKIAE